MDTRPRPRPMYTRSTQVRLSLVLASSAWVLALFSQRTERGRAGWFDGGFVLLRGGSSRSAGRRNNGDTRPHARLRLHHLFRPPATSRQGLFIGSAKSYRRIVAAVVASAKPRSLCYVVCIRQDFSGFSFQMRDIY
jgi:hypothetical protein